MFLITMSLPESVSNWVAENQDELQMIDSQARTGLIKLATKDLQKAQQLLAMMIIERLRSAREEELSARRECWAAKSNLTLCKGKINISYT